MWAPEALKEWHDFYVLVGTAGATLLALLFVALSLGVGYLTEERQSATRAFMSPVVVHFTSVFFLSAVALFPWHEAKFFTALIGVTALIGAVEIPVVEERDFFDDFCVPHLKVPGVSIAIGFSVPQRGCGIEQDDDHIAI